MALLTQLLSFSLQLRPLLLLLLLLQIDRTASSNWAQSSGDFAQNVVFPKVPSPDNPHWSGRFGHSTVIALNQNADPNVANLGQVYLMGGDSDDGDTTRRDFSMGKIDTTWNNGYKNDVWRMSGTEWLTRGDMRVRTKYRQKSTKVMSHIKWEKIQAGLAPPVGVTYDDWIVCQPYFSGYGGVTGVKHSRCGSNVNSVQWSPRRHHAAVYFKGSDSKWAIYLMGGRAREYLELSETRSVGGVLQSIQPRVREAGGAGFSHFTTKREAIVYKSDVWKSYDGVSWELVTSGCVAPQASLINQGNTHDQGYGVGPKKKGGSSKQCSSEADCTGAESCDFTKGTCFCTMWTSREQHAVVAYKDFMYLSGGYASYLYTQQADCGDYACGDTDASAYRYYMNDVWRSPDGLKWQMLTESALSYNTRSSLNSKPHAFPRGGHVMLVFDPPPVYPLSFADTNAYHNQPESNYNANLPELWVIGGRGGESLFSKLSLNLPFTDANYYYSDIWVSRAQDMNGKGLGEQSSWHLLVSTNGVSAPNDDAAPSSTSQPALGANPWWQGRTGHTVTLSCTWPQTNCLTSLPPGAKGSQLQRFLYIFGGQGYTNPTPPTTVGSGTFFSDVWAWRPDEPEETFQLDFTAGALFGTGDGSNFHYTNNSPSLDYVTPGSPVSMLMFEQVLPIKLDRNDNRRLIKRAYLTQDEIWQLNNNSIVNIQDFANPTTAGVYPMLKLRGYPPSAGFHVDKVCDVRALAIAVASKCTVTVPSETLYLGQRNQPRNVLPEWAAGPPGIKTSGIAWHGPGRADYWALYPFGQGTDDPPSQLLHWDGCTPTSAIINPIRGTNVAGLGWVQQVGSVKDPAEQLQEIQCQWTPGVRAYHTALYYEDRLYIFGGKSNSPASPIFMADTWYRDAILPTTRFKSAPKSYTPNPFFYFTPDEPGVTFEYRVWDPVRYMEVRPWTTCTIKTDVGWLNWRKKGPGNGMYTLYVRSVDPAGNRDERYVNNQNVWTWYYVSPTPYDIIFISIGSFIALGLFGYLEYRRRVRKAAMERYAMKRMRRKFKAMQRDIDGRAVDWRSLYMESKAAEEALKGKKKAKKAVRDKKAEKREKDKKKREKEKEMIKKKLKAEGAKKSKEAKSKGSVGDEGLDDGVKKEEKPKAKEKKDKKGKGKEDGADSPDEKGSKSKDKDKKLKDYEKVDKGKKDETPKDPLEEGVKQRKSNKRFKDYEVAESGDKGDGGEQKKDL